MMSRTALPSAAGARRARRGVVRGSFLAVSCCCATFLSSSRQAGGLSVGARCLAPRARAPFFPKRPRSSMVRSNAPRSVIMEAASNDLERTGALGNLSAERYPFLQKVVLDSEVLGSIRDSMTRVKREMQDAAAAEDFWKAAALQKQLHELRQQDPLAMIEDALASSIANEAYQEAAQLRDARDRLLQEMPVRGGAVTDRIIVLGAQGEGVVTTDPAGTPEAIRRFLSKEEVRKLKQSGQAQQPAWSPDGSKVAFTVLKVGVNKIEEARVVVYEEATQERLLSVRVPQAPFMLMWSPDSERLTYLSNTAESKVQLVEVDVARAESPGRARARRLDKGTPLFYAFTKARPRQADIVTHNGDRGGVFRRRSATGEWDEIARFKSPAAAVFMAPATHVVRGEDAVVFVEDGHLVTVMLDGGQKKRICPVRGFSNFVMSPNGERLALMQQDLATGFYSISVLQGKDAFDPLSDAAVEQVEVPVDRVILGCYWSPDSSRLLCLATQANKNELAVARNSMKMGFNLKGRWVVYDCATRRTLKFGEFVPRPFFMRVYLPFFDQFNTCFTPWSPDSKSFCYSSVEGGFIQTVPDSGAEAEPPQLLSKNVEICSWSWS